MEIFQEGCTGDSWPELLKRMAQANATRCCAPSGHLMTTNTNNRMRRNCWAHFRKEIEELEPTLIFFHGAYLKGSFLEALQAEGIRPRQPVDDFEECRLVEWAVFARPFASILAFFHHPARGAFGRQWERTTALIRRLQQEGYLPTFSQGWKSM